MRAARGYARLTRPALARRVALSVPQIKLIEDAQRTVTTREELLAIGRACEVPDEFMELGFRGAEEVYDELVRLFAVVLSRDMPTILVEAERLGVELPVTLDPRRQAAAAPVRLADTPSNGGVERRRKVRRAAG